jgi:voltage-dependent potassium channel beta subunit
VEYRRLGRTGLKVSQIGLGNWLTHGGSIDDATAHACVKAAFEAGINFFDTADAYAAGKAEQVLGAVVRDLPRPELVIATKVYWGIFKGPNGRGLSRKHILEACEASLGRLGLDYVDLYQVHRTDPQTPIDETLRAMDDLIRQGKVLYAGCSNFACADLAEALLIAQRDRITRFDSSQPRYSMLDRRVEAEHLPLCGRFGIGVVCYSPLAQGILTGKYTAADAPPAGSRLAEKKSGQLTEANLARVRRLEAIAGRLGCTMAQLALAWVLRRPELSSAIIGATRVEQITENAAAADVELSEEVLSQIEEALA